MATRWSIQLLGGLRAEQDGRVVTRFRTQKAASLLAYLAYYRHQQHPREVLIELLWPESDLDVGRNRLSVALSSLRHQLEPPGVPAGAVIVADRASVRLNPAAVSTDVAEFEAALRSAERAGSNLEREQFLVHALDLYRGPLLAGYYEEWVPAEQDRLAEQYLQALRQLIALGEQAGDFPRALDYARRAVAADPLREEVHQDLMRLYVAQGQPSAALQQYRELARVLHEELGEMPSPATRQLARDIDGGRSSIPPPKAQPARPQPERRNAELRAQAPLGTVTFLLTDVEGSTALREKAGDAFQTALVSHHALLRREFHRHGGYEVKEIGDSFLVAFERAGDALACALAGQRALSAHPWPAEVGALSVRMALHTGDVELQDGDYEGLILHHTPGMVVAAHGGQILCSEITAGVLQRSGIIAWELGVRLVDLGMYRLRDATSAEHLFQVEYAAMPRREFPALRAQAGHAGNLPLQLTRFFGREPELTQLRRMLLSDAMRLVTLTGPGGSGKTRLAMELAGQLAEALRGAVWFVPLADLADAHLIASAIRDTLRLPHSPHLTPLEQLMEALSRQPALLVLDNFEHLLEGAPIVRALLEGLPTLNCLVTSRQPLALQGEQEFPVSPLPTPTGAATPERLTLFESVQLFVDRAQSVKPDFQITDANASAVAELCERLEGIPLALELAAARAQILTPSQMLAQLERRLDFLVSRGRDVAARHRTLRAAIEWGHRLLAADLQRFFARLSVFRGGWSLEAAEAVTEAPLALDYLAQLRECSLVQVEERAQTMRFRMLETLREYANEQLSPEEQSAAERRHAEYHLALVEAARLDGPEERETLGRLEAEQDNLRKALGWGLENDPEYALRLAVALSPSWDARCDYREGHEALARALERGPAAPAELRLAALAWAGKMAYSHGDYPEAKALLERCLDLGRGRECDAAIARALWVLGRVANFQRDAARARDLIGESLRICRERGDQRGMADALLVLGNLAFSSVDAAAGRSMHGESLAIYRQLGSRRGIEWILRNMGIKADEQGDAARASSLLTESLAIARDLDNKTLPRFALVALARVACRQGDYASARALLAESLGICRRLGDKRVIVECLEELADVARAQAQFARAARLFGAAAAQREVIDLVIFDATRDAALPRVRAALGDAAFTAAWEAGRGLTWQEAAEYALEAEPHAGGGSVG